MRAAIARCCVLAILAIVLSGVDARGALVPTQPGGGGAEMRFPHTGGWWNGNDWSCLIRMSPRTDQADATVLRLDAPESLAVRRVDGRWVVTFAGTPQAYSVTLPEAPLITGEVAYLAVNHDSRAGTLSVLWRDSSMQSTLEASQTLAGFVPNASTQVVVFSGQSETPLDAVCDVMFRRHLLSRGDFELLWERQLVADPFRGDLDSPLDARIFEHLPGPATTAIETPIILAIGHAMTTLPRMGFNGAGQPDPAAPGLVVTTRNSIVYDRTKSIAPTSLFVARTMTLVTGLRYASPHGVLGERSPTGIFLEPTVEPAISPIFGALARGEAMPGLRRVLFASNSRAVRGFDGVQRPGGIFAGFAHERRSVLAGLASWRGDAIGASPIPSRNSYGGLRSANNTNYTRACSYGQQLSPGPGSPALLPAPGSYIEMSFQQLDGSLYTNDRSVVVAALALRYPGSGAARPRRVTQISAPAVRVFTDEPVVPLSTTEIESLVLTAFQSSVVVPGDLTGDVLPGWLVACVSGQNTGGLNQVATLNFDGTNTTIGLRHAWDITPAGGDIVAFGPMEYQWITTVHQADVAPIRGLRIVHDDASPGLSVCVVSWQTWAVGVDGFVIGGYGTSGAGFSSQLSQAFADMHPKFLAALGADAIALLTANQDSTPEPHLGAILDEFERVPGLEFAMLGDLRFPQPEIGPSHFVGWHSGLRAQALMRGRVFATALEHPLVGNGWDFVADGGMDDGAHPNFDGQIRLARGLLDLLAQATLDAPSCPGDTNGDGVVNFTDLNALLSAFGQSVPPGTGADLNGDGVVNFADLNALLSVFGVACD